MSLAAASISALLTAALVGIAVMYVRQRRHCSILQQELTRLRMEASQREVALRQRTELDSVKDEFISTVSHELRTPLTSIRGALGLLSGGLMGKMDDKAANLLRIASSNTDRLVRLINDILDLERMSSGSAPLQLRPCSLRDLILQSVDTMSAMATAAHVRIEVKTLPGDPPLTCELDPDRIQQVLTNLLSNAIKFSPEGSPVFVRTRTRPGEVTLCVEDRGRGIPANKLDSIFERFNQVDPSDARKKGGTGLGLTICRSIVVQHGGQIWAERNDSRTPAEPGTTFSVRLQRTEALDPPSDAAGAVQGTILIVEEDSGTRQVVADQVRRHGYAVLEADSGHAALGLAQHQPLEAILLDTDLPGGGAWHTLAKLKENSSTAPIPLVLLGVRPSAATVGSRGPMTGLAQRSPQSSSPYSLQAADLARAFHHGRHPAHLLLVESDPELASAVLSTVQAGSSLPQLRVDHVSSLQDAVQACTAYRPDLLLLDLNLPEGAGFALVSWLSRQPSFAALPLVVYSSREIGAEALDELRAHPAHFLEYARLQPREVEHLVMAMNRNP